MGGWWKDRQGGRRDWGPMDKTPRGGGHHPGGMDALPCGPLLRKACSVVRGREGGGTGRSRPDNGRGLFQ